MVTRKAFLEQLAAGGWAVVLAGCGGGGDSPAPSAAPGPAPAPPAPAPARACNVTSISGNHGHALVIPVADLDSTAPRTYSIQGSSSHSHQVTFSVAQLAQLKAGMTVAVVSTFDNNHEHGVSETCS